MTSRQEFPDVFDRKVKVKPSSIRLHAVALALSAAFPASQAQSEPKKDSQQLEQVIVTGARRVENLKDVPIAISAMKTEAIETVSVGGADIRAISGRVPSLNVESDFGRSFPRFYVRGLGNTDFDLNASQPVGLVFDDIVQENPILKGFPLFDIDQVELLRGPQGTLFGRNSPAGVMKFDSAKPGKRFEGYASIGLGRWSAVNLETAVNVPMGDWQLRASGMWQRQDDRVKNPLASATNTATSDLEGYSDKAARVQLAYRNGGFNALFKLQGRDYNGHATTFRANIMKRGTNELVDGFNAANYPTDGFNFQQLKSTALSARLRWDFDTVSLHSITGYDKADYFSRGDVDGGFGSRFGNIPDGPSYPGQPALVPFDAQTADGIPKLTQLTQEFRLQSTTQDPMQWIVGAYFFKEDLQVDSFNYDSFAVGDPQNGYAVQHQNAKSWALFGNVNFALSQDLKLRAGMRYTNDKKDFVASRTQHPFLPNIAPVRTNPSSTNFSWDLGANYSLDKATSLFGRVATGYRAPSVQGRVLFFDAGAVPAGTSPISVAKSEKVLSVEGGFKADLMNNRARVTGTVFSYQVKDLQLTAGSGEINQNRLVNADKAVGRGFELDAQAILSENWRTTLGLSYNQTEIKDKNLYVSPCGNRNFPFLQANTGCTVLDPDGPNGTVSINGNDLPRAPKVVWNWTLKYTRPVGNGEFYALTDWAFKDKYNMFLYEAVEYRAKSMLEGGLRAGYSWDNMEVSVYGRNITNRQQAIAAIDFNNLTGIINEPRSYGVTFRATF